MRADWEIYKRIDKKLSDPGAHCPACGADGYEDHEYEQFEDVDGKETLVKYKKADCDWVKLGVALGLPLEQIGKP